jgi:hypothetical protein
MPSGRHGRPRPSGATPEVEVHDVSPFRDRRRPSRLTGRAWPAALLLLTLLAAGCGASGGDGDGVASLSGSSPTTTTGGNAGADHEQALLAFARCMRDNGVPIQDPKVDSQGNLRLQPGQGGLGNVDRSTVEKAREACREHLEGVVQDFSPEDLSRFQDALLAYAKCMRENGYDMPDPDFSGAGGGPFGGRVQLDRDDPAFRKADQACRQHLAQLPGGGLPGGGSS